ncbi:hypothetical protein [Citrobacter koseri]|uniref:hypothetical protein n=1 Tax=Citrobacter koseri TaxID=545 RepID=UPI001F1FEEA2|nr:hypothetical protein [Citrobacter koseri]
MKDYPNGEDIIEQLGDMIKMLATVTFPERDSIIEKLQIIHNELVEVYCDSILSEYGFSVLKRTIRVKVKLKKSQPNDESLPVISSSILTLRDILKKNRENFWLWVDCYQNLPPKSIAPLDLMVIILILILILVGIGWIGGVFSPALHR